MIMQMIKSLMASADDVDEEKLEETSEPEPDRESKEFQRNTAEINAIMDKERESMSQLAQATGAEFLLVSSGENL